MKFEEVVELVKVVSHSGLTSFQYEEGNIKIGMEKTANMAGMESSEGQIVSISSVENKVQYVEANAVEEKEAEGQVIPCPLVGRFYSAPSEDAKPYVQIGDVVKKGQTLAIVEAMKLMNEIESDFDGTVVDVLVENGQAVDFGQPLFVIQ